MYKFLNRLLTATALLTAMGTAGATCSLPYYPVKEGLSRTYEVKGKGHSTYTETISKVSPSGFTLTNSSQPGLSSTFTCNASGVTGVNFNGGPPNATLKVTELRGVTFPAKMAPGTTWTSGVTMKGNAPGEEIINTLDTHSKVVGFEKVTVKAGTFNALKYQATVNVTMTVNGKKQQLPSMSSVMWVVEGVGLVKLSTAGAVVELVKYTK